MAKYAVFKFVDITYEDEIPATPEEAKLEKPFLLSYSDYVTIDKVRQDYCSFFQVPLLSNIMILTLTPEQAQQMSYEVFNSTIGKTGDIITQGQLLKKMRLFSGEVIYSFSCHYSLSDKLKAPNLNVGMDLRIIRGEYHERSNG